MCADNNPWVKTGYCERNNAWNMSRCLCPKENATGGGGTEIASTEPEDHCGTKGRGKYTFKSFKTFTYKSTPKFTYVH